MKAFFTIALVALAAVCAPSQAAASPERAIFSAPGQTGLSEMTPKRVEIAGAVSQPVQARAGLGLVGVLTFALFALGTVATGGARTLQDAQLIVTTALPAASATAHGLGLDTNTLTPGRIPNVEIGLTVPAVPSLVDAKTIIYTIEDSADNVTFAALADLPTVTSLGAGGVGDVAVDRRFKLPIATRRYVRASAVVLAAGGDNTAVSFSLGFYF